MSRGREMLRDVKLVVDGVRLPILREHAKASTHPSMLRAAVLGPFPKDVQAESSQPNQPMGQLGAHPWLASAGRLRGEAFSLLINGLVGA